MRSSSLVSPIALLPFPAHCDVHHSAAERHYGRQVKLLRDTAGDEASLLLLYNMVPAG